MKNQKRRGLLATIGAVAAGAVLALSGTVAANAANLALIDPNEEGSINITKLSTPPAGPVVNPNPTAPTTPLPTDADPVEGVVFRVSKVTTIDLTTNAGWQAAEALAPPVNPSDLAAPVYGITNSSGVPQSCTWNVGTEVCTLTTGPAFHGLAVGLYQIEEIQTPPGVVGSAPFLVTVPMTDPSSLDEWMYDIYVYPKNSVTDIFKTVADVPVSGNGMPQAGNSGALVDWTILADVPRIVNVQESATNPWVKPDSFVITDQLDGRLVANSVAVTLVDEDGDPLSSPNQLVTGDYTVTPTPLPAAAAGAKVTVTFNAGGLTKLQNAAAADGNQVKVVINTQVVEFPECTGTNDPDGCGTGIGDDEITNTASVTVNDGLAQESEETQTLWKPVSFIKTDSGSSPNPLDDAEFQVYGNKANAISDTAPLLTTDAVSGSSGTTGLVDLGALIRSDYQNGESVTAPADYRVYWLVETAAPDGFELLAAPIPFVVLGNGAYLATVDASGEVTDVGAALSSVVNVEANAGFTLPLTGGTGTILLTIGGLAVLALVIVVASRRRMAKLEE